MRRTLATSAVALSLALSATPTLVSAAADDGHAPSRPSAAQARGPVTQTAHERATAALDRARSLFSPAAARQRKQTGSAGREATLVLRDLFNSVDHLSPAQRREARAILARPTDGPNVDQDSYSVPSFKKCSAKICIHWVKRSKDKAPSQTWVNKMLTLMNKVWKQEVGKLGYRRPLPDNGRGGNNKFDVYLAQLANDGLYGYCVPEKTKPGFRWLASGYCVLDNDYTDAIFGLAPMKAAKATAAHEFFHAIQFAYDRLEDLWLMEGSATWMEELIFDNVDDNRQYLPLGQVREPLFPLDYYSPTSSSVYGNWAFFEFLSTKYGKGVVKKIWSKAGAFAGAPDMYSTQAVSKVLANHGGFKKNYTQFVAANLVPAAFYPEGEAWPSTKLANSGSPFVLTSGSPTTGPHGTRLLHMSSTTYQVDSSASLTGDQWRLRVQVDGPKSFKMPAAHVLVRKHDGSVKGYLVKLNANGNGSVEVPFDNTTVASAFVSLVNASTRFKCFKSYVYSCNGLPIDDGKSFKGQPYEFTASAVEVS